MAYYTWKSYKLKIDPLRIFEIFKNEKGCFFLDSSLNSNYSGRYSFLGIDPFYILSTYNQNPFTRLREILKRYKISSSHPPLPFLGGAAGYLAYDLGLILERKAKKIKKEDIGIPNSFFAFYNTLIIIDHLKKLLYIFAAGFPERDYRPAKLLSQLNFRKVYNLISRVKPGPTSRNRKTERPADPVRFSSNFSQEGYIAAIKKAKEYIRAGDIYQVNLSQQFTAKGNFLGDEIYIRLREISPSNFSAYLDCGDYQILSSSPERFLKLKDRIVITSPMKGTRPRSPNRIEDKKMRNELLRSNKDKAELLMIVDLERNDLGRVCSYDSVKVEALRQLEEYSTVFQTTATIQGKLHKDRDRVDLLRACFPGGSITGCPKIRAMEIIEELEPSRRCIYTGCLGYLSFCGDMDFNILIRTILRKENRLYFGVGGGIVADSRPEEEYQETLVKARAIFEAIA
jgi:para-aminobenzoate synthetase component 1